MVSFKIFRKEHLGNYLGHFGSIALLALLTSTLGVCTSYTAMTIGGPVTASSVTVSGSVTMNNVTANNATIQLLEASSGTLSSFMAVGTLLNDNAPSGRIGEYVASVESSGVNYPSSTQYGDLVSISLSPGDWNLTAMVDATATDENSTGIQCGISISSGNSTTGLNFGENRFDAPGMGVATGRGLCSVPNYRQSLTTPTTFYLKYMATYGAGLFPPTARGRLSARRVR